MKDYAEYDALGLAHLVANKQVSASELLDEAVSRAEKANSKLNCFASIYPEIAKKQIDEGLPQGPFTGVPFPTKDLWVEVNGAPLTNGAKTFANFIAEKDSEITIRYRNAGMTIFGATTSPEFGLTTTTESLLHGQTANPWDISRTSGGSSGGASSAVAAGVIPLAQASDGGGSIRIPAACTGLFGLKPSRGRTPFGPDKTEGWNGMSTIHCVSRSVRDSAALLDATHGIEVGSRYVAPEPVDNFMSALDRDPDSLRVAVWTEAPNGIKPDAEAQAGLDATCRLLESLGHEVIIDGPKLDGSALSKATLMTICASVAMAMDQVSENLGRDLTIDDMEKVTWRMTEFGKTIPMIEFAKANDAANIAAVALERFLDDQMCDLILAPTISRAPDKLGVLSLSPEDMDAYTDAVGSFAPWCPIFNQTGTPAMSVPLYWTESGLPLGMMFGARCGDEWLLLQLAGQLERAAPWAHRRPEVWVG